MDSPIATVIKEGLLQNHVFLTSRGIGAVTLQWNTCQNIEQVHQLLEVVNDPASHSWIRIERLRDHRLVRPILEAIESGEVPNLEFRTLLFFFSPFVTNTCSKYDVF